MFLIKSIVASSNSRFNSDQFPWEVTVRVEIDNKRWRKSAQNKTLGSLYLQVSNEVYGINQLIPAHNPLVGGSDKRASKGIKTLTLTYFLGSVDNARSLGLKVICGKYSAYSDYVSLYQYKSNVIPINRAV